MPREAPVTRMTLSARSLGSVMGGLLPTCQPATPLRHPDARNWIPAFVEMAAGSLAGSTRLAHHRDGLWVAAAAAVEVGERGRVVAGKAVVRELRARGVARNSADGVVETVDREELQRIRAD